MEFLSTIAIQPHASAVLISLDKPVYDRPCRTDQLKPRHMSYEDRSSRIHEMDVRSLVAGGFEDIDLHQEKTAGRYLTEDCRSLLPPGTSGTSESRSSY